MFSETPPCGYVFECQIGKGGFGTVYKGRNVVSKREVAIKVVKKCENDKKAMDSFFAEALLLKTLYHRNIVHFVSLSEGETATYLIMENVKGETLKKYVDCRGRMSEADVRTVFVQIIDAISYFHNKTGLLHRDLKADNIMIDPETKRIKIIDFGLAGKYSASSTGQFCGSPSMYFFNENAFFYVSALHFLLKKC